MQTNPFTDPATPSMAIVLKRIREDMALSDNRRAEVSSAIRTASRWFDVPLAAMPAHPDFLRRHFNRFAPSAVGVSKKRLANVRCGMIFALRHLGLTKRQHYLAGLTSDWQALREKLPDKYSWTSLSRLFHYCSANAIRPYEVNDAVSQAFLQALIAESLVKDPRISHQNACRAWNRMCGAVDLWPDIKLTVPRYAEHYILPWEVFPQSFREDVEAYLERQARPDPLDINAPIRPLKLRTIKAYRYELRRAASALVHRGYDPNQIQSLGDLVTIENVESILRFFLDRSEGRPMTSAANLARLLAKVARHWVRVDEDAVKHINRFAANITPPQEGLSKRNRQRLAPLRDEKNLVRLFLLPNKIQTELVKRNDIRRKDALLMQHAVALSILTYCPLRIGNVAALHLEENLRWSGPNMTGRLIIDIDGAVVKNSQTLSFPLPKDCADLLRLYVERFRPMLADETNRHLFPSTKPGRPKRADTLSKQISKLIHRTLGLEVNPHLYRHLVHIIVLRRFPGAYAMVSRILGHKSLQTAISNYAGEDIALAMQAFQELIVDAVNGRGGSKSPDNANIAYALNPQVV